MYAHCLFCNADLGRNEALEAFPVGRRLAYDADKGRLWVVCPACARWNLTPLEERWEAIEQAERLYCGTRLRVSTDNVGLARVADRVDLVRVGRAPRPEFAGWRYGSQLAARRRRYVLRATPAATLGLIGGGATIAARLAHVDIPGIGPIVSGAVAVFAADLIGKIADRGQHAIAHHLTGSAVSVAGRIRVTHGHASSARLVVRRGHLAESTLRAGPDGAFTLDLRHDTGRAELTGPVALAALTTLSPALNAAGAPDAVVRGAVHSVATRGGPDQYLALMARWVGRSTRASGGPPTQWFKATPIPESGLFALTEVQRLALEMVLHEDAERRAFDGELAALEAAWRDAEEIAAIADALALPRSVEAAWERLRGRVGAR